jgi:hypothetical protein
MSDRVRDTLTALRVDTDRVELLDPAGVRRRGRARTRHQVVGGLAAVVVVLVVAVGSSAALSGSTTAKPQLPAATPSASPLALADNPFLLDGDVTQVGPYESFRRSPDAVNEDQRPLQCMPSPTTLGASETNAALFFSDLDATFIEHILRFDDVNTAVAAVNRLSGAFAACPKGDPAQAKVEDTGPSFGLAGVSVDQSMDASRLTTPVAASEVSYYALGVARLANVVVVLEWTSMGLPDGLDGRTVWRDRTTNLLDTAAHRAVE